MKFSEDDLNDFKIEADELLILAETALLNYENGSPLSAQFASIFRAFHSIKGASGMLGLTALQAHVHKLENVLQNYKDKDSFGPKSVSFFLEGIDAIKELLKGRDIEFQYLEDVATSEEKNSPQDQSLSSHSKPIVYIVDDEPILLEVLADIIRDFDITIKTFVNPVEAFENFVVDRPQLVLSDMNMPGMSGLDLLKKLKEIDKDSMVIFISAYITKDVVMKSMELGCFGVIEKPFNESQILSIVSNSLERAKLKRVLDRAIEMLLFQVVDLGDFLQQNNKLEVFQIMKKEMSELIKARRLLR
ncbi:MAG: response regulator [Bacteriovoracaceae bacterium]